jgi:O-antigen chain-terminating methyltransferase
MLSYEQLFALRHCVGRMPAGPNTLRAKAGAVLVRIVQRMLFWYTPQIHRFHEAATAVVENVCSCMETETAAMRVMQDEIAQLRAEVRIQRAAVGPASVEYGPLDSSDPRFEHLLFTFHNRTGGAPEVRAAELHKHLSDIDRLAPPVPAGPWLDIGCGRGDWLRIASAAGREAIGLEDNRVAAAHCAGLGLKAVHCNPLYYLRTSGDAQYAVVSAMHVLNLYPIRYVSELVRESARTLKPAGVLLVECANPASLVAAADDGWSDPAHVRPLPVRTVEFLLEYYGLRVVLQRDLGAFPEDQQLPFAELEFVRQLNTHMYGPRTYLLFARKPERGADSRTNHVESLPR